MRLHSRRRLTGSRRRGEVLYSHSSFIPLRTTSTRQRRSGAATETRILEAAEVIFARYGYEGARMEQVAVQAGVEKANIYYYYKNVVVGKEVASRTPGGHPRRPVASPPHPAPRADRHVEPPENRCSLPDFNRLE